MYISVKGDYALQAIFDLATQPPGQPAKIGDIARRRQIPQKFLELILASLKQGGFVESRRGAEGGYLLARPPDQITVGQVVRFIEGSRKSESPRKSRGDNPFSNVWSRIDSAVAGVVDETTFADLAREWNEREGRYVPNWDI